MAELREQIERAVLAITIGPKPIVDAIVSLVLEERAKEAEACIPFDKPSEFKQRARELRALKGR